MIPHVSNSILVNSSRKDVHKSNTPEADHHFSLPGHKFNLHAEFTLIEQLNKTNLDKELLTFRSKKREDFWLYNLDNLQLHGFNGKLYFPNP